MTPDVHVFHLKLKRGLPRHNYIGPQKSIILISECKALWDERSDLQDQTRATKHRSRGHNIFTRARRRAWGRGESYAKGDSATYLSNTTAERGLQQSQLAQYRLLQCSLFCIMQSTFLPSGRAIAS